MLNTWIYPKRYTHVSIGAKWHIFNYVGETPLTRVQYFTNPNNALLYRIPTQKKNINVHCLFSPEKRGSISWSQLTAPTVLLQPFKHPRQKRTWAPPWPRVYTSWDVFLRLVAEMGRQIWGRKHFTRGTFKTLMWHCVAFHGNSWLIGICKKRILRNKKFRALVPLRNAFFSIQCGWFWKIHP